MIRTPNLESGKPNTANGAKATEKCLLRIVMALALLILPLMTDGLRWENPFAGTALSKSAAAGPAVIWRDPGAVELLDFADGPGGHQNRPRSPFMFVKELSTGRTPKIKVRDAQGREWIVKWGTEVKAENIATRIAWAAGYFVDSTYFIKAERIDGVKNLGPANEFVGPDGSFKEARFELWNDGYAEGKNWNWNENPFAGSRELNGLKIVVMLTSNWDNKDARDTFDGPNTAIIDHAENGRHELRYVVNDWGSTMGKWGPRFFYRDKWNCQAYSEQSARFISGVKDGVIDWGFMGSRNVSEGIRVEDVQWSLSYVGRITDNQIKAGLQASGATPEEVECFSTAIRRRINQMKEAVRIAASERKV